MAASGGCYDLLSGVSGATATGTAVSVVPCVYCFMAEATAFSAGTIALQILSRSNTWIAVANASATANGIVSPLYLPAGQYRAVLSGATAATGVNASLIAISSL